MSLTIKNRSLPEIYKDLGIEEKGKVQQYLDNTVSESLQPYVSFKIGVQEKSIKIATVLGSGRIIINVPYATYQAYSPKIHKRVGKRGTRPWERMKSDKKDSILRQTIAYARRING